MQLDMQRRDVLKFLMSVAGLSAIPAELMLALRQAQAEMSPSISSRTLNMHQDATVTVLSELIIPETDTPGAKAAKVNEFIDLLLTEWFDEADRTLFLQGLAQIDANSRQRFKAEFIACTPSQQAELVKQFDDAAMEFARTHKAAAVAQMAQHTSNFFYNFKRLTLVGYYTSEIGFKKELGKTVVPANHKGCAPLPEMRA